MHLFFRVLPFIVCMAAGSTQAALIETTETQLFDTVVVIDGLISNRSLSGGTRYLVNGPDEALGELVSAEFFFEGDYSGSLFGTSPAPGEFFNIPDIQFELGLTVSTEAPTFPDIRRDLFKISSVPASISPLYNIQCETQNTGRLATCGSDLWSGAISGSAPLDVFWFGFNDDTFLNVFAHGDITTGMITCFPSPQTCGLDGKLNWSGTFGVTYTYDDGMSAVPLPATSWLILAGAVVLVLRKNR